MMNKSLILKLNQLNRDFYEQTAQSFSDSRSYYWQGWNKLIPYVQEIASAHKNQLTVADIGCGNGRFGSFLAEQLPDIKINYLGFDNTQKLLEIAKQKNPGNYQKIDVITALLNNSLVTLLEKHQPNLISALGILHHLPSSELRQKFIINLSQALTKPGLLTFTTWNFLENQRFKKKVVDPKKVNLAQTDLEANDVILDWQRDQTAYRYCHYTDETELDSIIKASGLIELSRFKADGKSGNLNTYTVLKKEK